MFDRQTSGSPQTRATLISTNVTSMPADNRDEPRWWDFIAYRRRYMSDLVWYGLGLLAAGYGGSVGFSGWVRIVAAAVMLAGMVMIAAGIKRRVRAWRRDASQQAYEQHDPNRGGSDLD